MSASAAIETRGLSKDYGSGRGLFELDLDVRPGEVFGFLGPNGAGKSTTMRLLLDPLVQKSFHTLLAEVSARGRTVLLSSHTLSEVERVTDRMAILRAGRLVVVDSVENLRSVAVKRLEIEFAAPVPAAEFRALPGVTEATAEDRTVTVSFEGSADGVVKAAARHEVVGIRPREDDLEDIFLRYYQDPRA